MLVSYDFIGGTSNSGFDFNFASSFFCTWENDLKNDFMATGTTIRPDRHPQNQKTMKDIRRFLIGYWSDTHPLLHPHRPGARKIRGAGTTLTVIDESGMDGVAGPSPEGLEPEPEPEPETE